MQRSKNRVVAEHTLKILEQGYFFNPEGIRIVIRDEQAAAVANTELWKIDPLTALAENIVLEKRYETNTATCNDTTFNAIRRLVVKYPTHPIACLNFASAKNPGCGFLNGAQAQEECLARASGLYNCLLEGKDYYELHRKMKSCLYTDTMIYSPLVPIFKYENGEMMGNFVLASIVTSAAVNAGVVRKQEKSGIPLILPTMQGRVDKLLALFAHQKAEILVLGAWGCGVFQNEPEQIAELFYSALRTKYEGVFKHVEFAVLSKNTDKFIKPFEDRFGKLS